MIKTETITAKIKNRILVTEAPIFSGEAVRFRLDFEIGEADASEHKIILFGDDKTALAEARFTAFGGAWFADLNTATNEMAAYFEGVPVDATKSIGAMVVNTQTADVITRGNVLVVSTPFPENLSPCPQTYSYLTTEEFSSSMAAVESEISGKASASDFIQLSSDVADLSADLANKADSSTVEDLASQLEDWGEVVTDLYSAMGSKADQNTVDGLAEIITELDGTKAESSTVDTLTDDLSSLSADMTTLSADVVSMSSAIDNKAEASDVADLALEVEYIGQGLADKAESSTVAALSSTVADLAARVAALEGRA